MIRLLTVGFLTGCFLCPSGAAQVTAVQGEQVWTGQEIVDNGVVVFEGGRIIAAGPRETTAIPPGATLLRSRWVTPGLFSAYSQTGLSDLELEDSTNDGEASGSDYSVALDAADSFNPDAVSVDVTRQEGFTRMAVALRPSHNIFGGQGLIADTSGRLDVRPERRAFVLVSLGEPGAARAGGSRSAALAQLRAALDDARTFPARYAGSNDGTALNRTDAAAFVPAARGAQTILIEAHRASDLNVIMDLYEQSPGLRIAILGADEGWRVADRLARLKIPVIVDSYSNLPASFAQLAATSENAARLSEAGVPLSIVTFDATHQAQLARQVAGNAVAAGLPHSEALRALTSGPANVFGREDMGVLRPGARADVVMWDGDPLEVTSAPQRLYIDGVLQDTETRQSRLRQRYLEPGKGDRPQAYIKP